MTKSDEAIEKLKTLGYTDEKLKQLLPMVLENVEEQVALDFAGVTTDEETNQYEARIKSATNSDEMKAVLLEMAQRAYGSTYEQKFDELLSDELNKTADLTSTIRGTYHKYMSGDPDTVKAVNQMQNSGQVQELLDDMQQSGVDFVKAATE